MQDVTEALFTSGNSVERHVGSLLEVECGLLLAQTLLLVQCAQDTEDWCQTPQDEVSGGATDAQHLTQRIQGEAQSFRVTCDALQAVGLIFALRE